MTTPRYRHTTPGQEVQESDLNLVALDAALADDVVLANLLRLAPYDGSNVAKAIVPYAVYGSSTPMVAPNGASGSVKLMPFGAIVGSRNSIADAATAALNWSDVRSAVYAPTDDNATLGHKVSFTANGSGNARWDLVYVVFGAEQDGPTVSRGVRAPGSNPLDPPVATPLVVEKIQTLTIGVVTGTPGASPALPALPSDSLGSGLFYIAIAAVRIPDGFGNTSTVLPGDIFMQAPIVPIARALGVVTRRAPDRFAAKLPAGTVASWGSSGARPPQALPATQQGGEDLEFGFDATGASPLIGDTVVLDASVDWRKRNFLVFASSKTSATQFAWQTGATSGAIPEAGNNPVAVQTGQSTIDDSAAVLGVSSRNAGVVCYLDHAALAPIASGANAFGLYVDLATGALKVFYKGTPGVPLWIRVSASAPIDNA